jgi:tetratricopeptide (TPR) repeat protein
VAIQPLTLRNASTPGSTRADAHARKAARLADRGDFVAADIAATFALALQPNQPVALRVSGIVQRWRGSPGLAEATLRAALSIAPDDKRARRELAASLADQRRISEAIAELQMVSPADADVWFQIGALHDRNSDAPAALEAAANATRLSSQHVGAQFLAARALTSVGRTDEAAALYRRLARIPAQAAKAWFALLDLKTIRIAPEELHLIERLESSPKSSDDDRILAGFALGQAYETADRPTDAVRAFDAANQRRSRQSPWDAQSFVEQIRAIRDAFAGPARECASARGAEVIFVLGMPRSGTTLVEQILAAHPEVVGASELPDLAQIIADESRRRGKPFPAWACEADEDTWTRLGEEYLARTKRWQSGLRFTDKMPENWLYVGAILRMLPAARVIGCERDPVETMWSCYKQMFAPGQLGWSYDVDMLAIYSVACRHLWRHFQSIEPHRCRTQSYEALVADLETEVRALLRFAGLEFHADCLNFAAAPGETRTASAAQVRQPLNKATARRTRYAGALEHLAAALDLAEKASFD